MIDGPELRARRQAAWSKELLDPKTAGVAALKLEGLGTTAVDTLKEGLKSPNDQVQFFSAEALAYLNDTAGVEVLGETVIRQPEFRAYALAALASLDQSASHMKLRKLMDEPDVEVRYGAFNALRTLDPTDAYLGRVPVLNDPKPDEDEDRPHDSMAMEIAASARRRHRPEDPFALYIVDSRGPAAGPRVADPADRDRHLRPAAEAADPDRAGRRRDPGQRRRQRREGRAEPRSSRRGAATPTPRSRARWSWPTWSAGPPTSGATLPPDRRRCSRRPTSRGTCPASSSWTPCRPPARRISRRSWAGTSTPSGTTPSAGPPPSATRPLAAAAGPVQSRSRHESRPGLRRPASTPRRRQRPSVAGRSLRRGAAAPAGRAGLAGRQGDPTAPGGPGAAAGDRQEG